MATPSVARSSARNVNSQAILNGGLVIIQSAFVSGPSFNNYFPTRFWRFFRVRVFPVTPFRIDHLDRHSDRLVLPRWYHSDAVDRQTCPFQRNASRRFATRCTSWVTLTHKTALVRAVFADAVSGGTLRETAGWTRSPGLPSRSLGMRSISFPVVAPVIVTAGDIAPMKPISSGRGTSYHIDYGCCGAFPAAHSPSVVN
jgi:hypothetical protein